MVVVQRISTWWSKASRGAPGAVRRSALPRAYPVTPSSSSYLYEGHRRREWEGDFEDRLVETTEGDVLPQTAGNLSLLLEDGTLRVDVWWSGQMGSPRRGRRTEALRLVNGELGQVLTNGRHSVEGGWLYVEDTYNVAMTPAVDAALFTARPPVRRFDFRARLR
jgi:hypothetical protein